MQLIKKLEEHMVCSLCLNQFQNPATLHCGHTFCNSCLINYIEISRQKQCRCPLCKRNFEEGDIFFVKVIENFLECLQIEKLQLNRVKENPYDEMLVTCSGLNEQERDILNIFGEKFNIQVDQTFAANAQILIVVANRNRQAIRTPNYLKGLILSMQIISYDWIKQSLRKQELQNHEKYRVTGDEHCDIIALNQQHNLQRMFEGMKFSIKRLDERKSVQFGLLKELIIMCRGTVLKKNVRDDYSIPILFIEGSDVFLRYYKDMIRHTWIYDCISNGRIINQQIYKI